MVWPCPVDVDTYVERAAEIEVPRPPCPSCGALTWRWSRYQRHLRRDADRLIWAPRVCCTGCGETQALIPWFVLPWRWDEVSVIGRAVELAAQGWGHRRIAAALGRPATTVRGWLRRIRRSARELSAELLAMAVAWGWSSWEVPTLALPRLVAAVGALAQQWARPAGPGGALGGGQPGHRREAAGDQQSRALGAGRDVGLDSGVVRLGGP